MEPKLAEALNEKHPDALFFLGIAQALQSMAIVLLDTEEKRSAVQEILNKLAEDSLHSVLTEDRKARFLEGLSSLGVAMTIAQGSS